MKLTVSRKAHFNAAHRLYNSKWSEDKNNQVFGKCNNPNFHGHNYELTVSVTGPVNSETGYVIDMALSEKLFPPKTSKHSFSNYLPPIMLEIEKLR